MTTVREHEAHPQGPPSESPEQVDLLRHALTNGAAVIAGLLTDHPTAEDARTAARAWLRTWEAYRIAARMTKTSANLSAIAGGR